ncbi:MAG: hypothetical protein ITG03_03400 [Sphingorhabdus sp.]|nr:hypothetical protein [Sphingorhabdus sp.]
MCFSSAQAIPLALFWVKRSSIAMVETLDKMSLANRLDAIGKTEAP